MLASIQVANFTWPGGDEAIGSTLADVGRAADDGGFDTLWVMDHFFQLEPLLGPADNAMLEGYSALAYLAGVTERIRLGTLVTGVNYRQPGFLAKTVTTLDVLSGGRAWLGIGAGWYEREALGLGLPFPPLRDRFEELEEALQIILQMWAGDRSPYEGKHFHLTEPVNSPQVIAQPRPRILIGGSGEKKTLRMVAQYADACNFFPFGGDDELRHKLAVLLEHCDRLGRDDKEISKTIAGLLYTGQPATEVIEQCRHFGSLGFDHVIFNVPADYEVKPVAALGREVVPALAEL